MTQSPGLQCRVPGDMVIYEAIDSDNLHLCLLQASNNVTCRSRLASHTWESQIQLGGSGNFSNLFFIITTNSSRNTRQIEIINHGMQSQFFPRGPVPSSLSRIGQLSTQRHYPAAFEYG